MPWVVVITKYQGMVKQVVLTLDLQMTLVMKVGVMKTHLGMTIIAEVVVTIGRMTIGGIFSLVMRGPGKETSQKSKEC